MSNLFLLRPDEVSRLSLLAGGYLLLAAQGTSAFDSTAGVSGRKRRRRIRLPSGAVIEVNDDSRRIIEHKESEPQQAQPDQSREIGEYSGLPVPEASFVTIPRGVGPQFANPVLTSSGPDGMVVPSNIEYPPEMSAGDRAAIDAAIEEEAMALLIAME